MGAVLALTEQEFYKGRDTLYASELTDAIRDNADAALYRASLLLVAFGERREITSGWRPAAVNAATVGAATHSNHMVGEAVDLEDADGRLDEWCLQNPETLAELGLWQEHPSATPGWCHVQIVPPHSGHRVFYP